MNTTDIERCRKRIIQYLWDPEPKNDEEPGSPIWCLGTYYAPPRHKEAAGEQITGDNGIRSNTTGEGQADWPEGFLSDFESRIWMTYRSNFTPIPKESNQEGNSSLTLTVRLRSQLLESQGFTTDTGWGCMIRSGQSLLANAMAILSLGRDWRRDESREEVQLLSLFADTPEAPFSIHNFVKYGSEFCGKHTGEWFGPSATARCIRGLTMNYKQSMLQVYITDDNSDVYQDKFMNVSRNDQGIMQPTLILLGLRLGIDRVTAVYWDGLKTMLQFPQSVGIAGGRPSASHYFVGVQGSHFFYLDPHTTHPAVHHDIMGHPYTKDEIDTYHTRRLRRLHIQDMDPSMLIGFLIKDERDWEDWKARVKSIEGKAIINIYTESNSVSFQERTEALDEVEAFDDE
ncbi:hypothetical protein BJX63DRAFT_420082 [Aspergillus granulosus]|uniref:Cysteine protease n=1 Tax=Aspergillus granulosus TaxID=176169 RepID=A0ABR4HNS5_9EURO